MENELDYLYLQMKRTYLLIRAYLVPIHCIDGNHLSTNKKCVKGKK